VLDVYPQILPAPPSYHIALMPTDPLNKLRMDIVRDKAQAHGSKYTWFHGFWIALIKIDGNMPIKVNGHDAQGFTC